MRFRYLSAWLKEQGACDPAIQWAKKYRTSWKRAYSEIPNAGWLVWLWDKLHIPTALTNIAVLYVAQNTLSKTKNDNEAFHFLYLVEQCLLYPNNTWLVTRLVQQALRMSRSSPARLLCEQAALMVSREYTVLSVLGDYRPVYEATAKALVRQIPFETVLDYWKRGENVNDDRKA